MDGKFDECFIEPQVGSVAVSVEGGSCSYFVVSMAAALSRRGVRLMENGSPARCLAKIQYFE